MYETAVTVAKSEIEALPAVIPLLQRIAAALPVNDEYVVDFLSVLHVLEQFACDEEE